MFTVGMYCSRMMARGLRIGLVVDCTALDLEEFDPLPDTTTATKVSVGKNVSSVKKKKNALDRRVRYFHNPSEWDDFDVEYYRLMPPKSSDEENGDSQEDHNEPLASQVLGEFFRVINNFIQKSQAAKSKSEGHSTTAHISLFDSRGGLGVASYLAAAYMCHALKAPVHAALEAVKEGSPSQPSSVDGSRKWGLCDLRLLKDLQTRFKGSREIVIEGGVPSWWWAVEEEDDNDDEDEVKGGDLNLDASTIIVETKDSGNRKRKDERIIIPPCCMSVEQAKDSKRQRTNGALHHPSGLFPVLPKETLEPISIDSSKAVRALTVLAQLTQSSLPLASLPFKPEVDISNITSLVGGDSATSNILQSMKSSFDCFKVTWLSTQGRRGLLLILSEATYFLEQLTESSTSNPSPISVSVVTNMNFPSAKDPQIQQHRTLLDVVLVHDVEKASQCYRFYIIDILCIEGGMVWHKSWKERWRFLNDGVLIPRKKEEASGHKYQKEPIRIRAKEYFPLQKLEYVIKDVCAGVGHDAKGVMIIPMGAYGIKKADCSSENQGAKSETNAVVWKQGGKADEQQLLALLLR